MIGPAGRTHLPAVRAQLMVEPEVMRTSGTHQFHLGRLAANQQEVVSKHNLFTNFINLRCAQPVNPLICKAFQARYPGMDRLQDMTEIMLSWFSKSYFERSGRPYPGLTYTEVVYRDSQGRAHLDIAAPVVPNFGTLADKKNLDIISNPAEAVEQSLMRGLLFGDYDVTFHDDNTAVVTADGHMSDGRPLKRGEVLASDFGEAGHSGNAWLGVPYGSNTLLARFPQHVQPAMDNLLSLDHAAVRDQVQRGGEHVTAWTDPLTDHFTGILSDNLDRMRDRWLSNPTSLYPAGTLNPLRLPLWNTQKYLIIAATQIPRNYERTRRQGLLDTIPDNTAMAERILHWLKPPAG